MNRKGDYGYSIAVERIREHSKQGNMMKHTLKFSLFVIGCLFLSACNGGEEAPIDMDQIDGADVREIEVIGIDRMLFVVSEPAEGLVTGDQIGDEYVLQEIHARPGEQIRITLMTRSDMPANAMSHNFLLLDQETNTDEFVNTSMGAADNNYVAVEMADQVIVTTEMLGGGESETIEFTVPNETGDYDYVCTFPGHYAAGMRGVLVVEE